ncbi:MAG TPA: flagellar basal body-associated protein FliL [Nitrosospira sp.]|nr:flagellar basal body-associated protein FliL [Nitrosospira sp.]
MASRAIKQANGKKEGDTEQKSKLKWVIVIASTVLLLAAGWGGAAWYFIQSKDSPAAPSKPKLPVFVNLETFTVNLQPEHSEQHLQTNLTLKVEDTAAVDAIKLHMPEVRNRILLLLSNKTAGQLMTVEGKRKLAQELTVEINQQFAERKADGQVVESVLFTSFVIQ